MIRIFKTTLINVRNIFVEEQVSPSRQLAIKNYNFYRVKELNYKGNLGV